MKASTIIIHILYGFIIEFKVVLSQNLSSHWVKSIPPIPAPLVLVEQGQLRGLVNTNWKGGKFFSFMSIPYAKKPIRELRFKDPWPPDKWDGVRDATVDLPHCIQHNTNLQIVGREDCLYLNVHTSRLTGIAPVMVYIHGGGYLGSSGNSEFLGPQFLLTEDIVLVTFNYRLGLFGFLNFDDPRVGVPGNAGMKDQVLALQWVQRNIDKFGGNPNRVTIFGQCVGATSVHLHMMSPLSKPLFHRAIALSGTALHLWAMGSKDTGIIAAKILGYKTKDPRLMFNRLQKARANQIMKIQEDFALLPISHKNLIGPVVEHEHNGTIFLSESPFVTLMKGDFKRCHFMLGTTDRPSLLYEVLEFRETGMVTALEELDIVPYTLSLNKYTLSLVYNEIMEAYKMRGLEAGTPEYRQLLDDIFMNYFLYVTVSKHADMNHRNMYLYKFSASTRLNFFKFSTRRTARLDGASYMDDIGYLFRNPKTPSSLHVQSHEGKCVTRFVKLFVNFAKRGNPTPTGNKMNITWKPVEKNELNYLHFHTNFMVMKINPFKRMKLWDSIYSRFSPQCIHDSLGDRSCNGEILLQENDTDANLEYETDILGEESSGKNEVELEDNLGNNDDRELEFDESIDNEVDRNVNYDYMVHGKVRKNTGDEVEANASSENLAEFTVTAETETLENGSDVTESANKPVQTTEETLLQQ